MTRLVAWVAILVVSCAVAFADGTVGMLGDPDRIVFEGNDTFPAADLVAGLTRNTEFVLASHPLTSRAIYTREIARLLTAGYHNAGFPEAEVSAGVDDEKNELRVTIQEGPRFMKGGIRVEGGHRTIPIDGLRTHLTSRHPEPDADPTDPHPPMSSPVWVTGKPASFAPAAAAYATEDVRKALEDLGYFFVTFDVEVVPSATERTADLVIRIEDEGPPGTVDRIVINGATINSPERIIEKLGLHPGMAINREKLRAIEHALWATGRFVKHKATITPPGRYQQGLALTLDVMDLHDSPPLDQELSETEQVLLRHLAWCNSFDERDEDWILEADCEEPFPFKLQVLISNDGVFVHGTLTRKQGPAIEWRFAFEPDSVVVFSYGRKRRLRIADEGLAPFVSVVMGPGLDDPKRIEKLRMRLSAQIGKGTARKAFRLRVDPVCALVDARRYTIEIDREKTIMARDIESTTFETATGRLIEYVSGSGPGGLWLTARHGAYRDAMAAALAATPNEDTTDSKRWPEDVCRFVIEEWVSQVAADSSNGKTRAPLARLAMKATPGWSRLLDHVTRNPMFRAESFSIPVGAAEAKRAAESGGVTYAQLIMPVTGSLFPYGTWPWSMGRAFVCLLNGRQEQGLRELAELMRSDAMGPVGYHVLAALMDRLSNKNAQPIALLGLKRLSLEHFHRDAVPLVVDNDRLPGLAARDFVRFLGDLEPDDVEILVAYLEPHVKEGIRTCVEAAREYRDEPDREQTRHVLEALWKSSLHDSVKDDLERIAK